MISAFVVGLVPSIGPSAGCTLRYRIRLTGAHARPAWRRCGGAAVLCSPRTNAASACKGPLYQACICPHRDARRPLPYANFGPVSYVQIAYLSFAYPPHIINSRIYDVGINCHKYVKYVDSRTALLCLWCSLLSCLNLQHILWLPTLQCSPWLPHL